MTEKLFCARLDLFFLDEEWFRINQERQLSLLITHQAHEAYKKCRLLSYFLESGESDIDHHLHLIPFSLRKCCMALFIFPASYLIFSAKWNMFIWEELNLNPKGSTINHLGGLVRIFANGIFFFGLPLINFFLEMLRTIFFFNSDHAPPRWLMVDP